MTSASNQSPPVLGSSPEDHAVTGDGTMADNGDDATRDVSAGSASTNFAQPPIPPHVDPIMQFMRMMQQSQAEATAAAVAIQQQHQLQMQEQQQRAAEAASIQMTEMVRLMAAGQKSHHANVKLDIKNFSKIDKFSNK